MQIINRGVKLTRFFKRKSSCVTARNLPPATYKYRSPVGGGGGVPCPARKDLGPKTGEHPPSPPGKDLGPETRVPPSQ